MEIQNSPVNPYMQPPAEIEMENGVPVKPFPAERTWIKRFYNWTGAVLLIQMGTALIISIMILLFGQLFLAGRTGGFMNGLENRQDIAFLSVLATLIAYLTANLFAFGLGCKVAKINLRPLFSWKGVSGKLILGALLIGFGIQAVAVFFSEFGIRLIEAWTGVDMEKLMTLLQPTTPAAEVIFAAYACIVAPITEELLFRGFVLKNLSRVNVRFGILASALIFGLVHANIGQFLLAFPLGIVLAYITVKSESIFPAMIVHFVVNITATMLTKIIDMNQTFGKTLTTVWYVAALVLGLLALVLARTVFRQRLPKASPARKKRGWPLYFSSWSLLLNTILYGVCIVVPLLFIPLLPILVPILEKMY